MKCAVKSIFVATLFTISAHCIAKVKVEIVDSKQKIAVLKIVEKIEYEEEELFITEYNKLIENGYKLKLNAVVLNSVGGNGYAARKIGEFVREKRLNTYVASNGNCASACVDVLIGGVVRMAYGRIAVHRNTYSAEFPTERLENAFRNADKKTTAHVEAMGISNLLADAMLNTPNWAIRELDDRERRRWGVHGTDRIYEEMWFRKTASETGLSLDEVRDSFSKHIAPCKSKPINFEMTFWDCVRGKINK